MSHVVYLVEFDRKELPNKYVGSKSNAEVREGKVWSSGKEYLTSSTDSLIFELFGSGVEYKFTQLGSYDSYQEALQAEKNFQLERNVVLDPMYFNKAIATIRNNFTDPGFGTFKHRETGKCIRLEVDHPSVKDGTYVGVTRGRVIPEEERKGKGLAGEANPFFGKKHTEATKKTIGAITTKTSQEYWDTITDEEMTRRKKLFSEANKGKQKSKEYRDMITGSVNMRNPMTGEIKRVYKEDREEYERIGWINALAGIVQIKHACIHCGVNANGGNIKRWHNDNCKHKPNDGERGSE